MAKFIDDEDFQNQLKGVDSALGDVRSSLEKMQGGEISPLDAESSYQKFRKKLQAFVVEVNDIDDDVRKMSYPTTSFGKMAPDALLRKFKEEDRRAKESIDKGKKGELTRGAATAFKAEGSTAGQMLDEAGRIQKEDLSATKRMQRQLDQTEQQATETMKILKDQTDQIGKVHQDLAEIDDTLKMATTELTRYVRRLATDKVIMGFIGLIVLGILAIIILNAVGVIDDEDVNAPDIVPDVDV